MRYDPASDWTDVDGVKDLVRSHPFVTLVSPTTDGLVASHYPVLVDDSASGIVLLGHVGRPDDETHELGRHEVLVVAGGAHGYVSSSWYDRDVPSAPTWDFTVAHLHGVPTLLDPATNLRTLGLLVDHFEQHVERPRPMAGTEADAAYTERIAHGTVGFRLAVTRFEAKRKLSQEKPAATARAVADALATPGPYENQPLAHDVRAALEERD